MQTISLRDCEIAVINRPEDTLRRASVTEMTSRLSLPARFVSSVSCNPGWIGCALGHLKALRSWSGQRPLLVLEDDVAPSHGFQESFDVPEDADALYIGLSRYGVVECFGWMTCEDSVISEEISPTIVQIYNMLTCHAVIYFSMAWREAVIAEIHKSIMDYYQPHDIAVAQIQGYFKIYALRQPAFYQSAALQHEERKVVAANTSINLVPLAPDAKLAAWGPQGTQYATLDRKGPRLTWKAA